ASAVAARGGGDASSDWRCPTRWRRPVRPAIGGSVRRTCASKTIAPTRLPRRAIKEEAAAAISSAASRFSVRAVPQSSEALESTISQASSPRLGCDSRTKMRSERAVRFQSISRASSPNWYSLTSANSTPGPRERERSSPQVCKPHRLTTVHANGRGSFVILTSLPGILLSEDDTAISEVEPRPLGGIDDATHDVVGGDA